MTQTTVTSKGRVTIPVEFRRKYGIRAGMKMEFVDTSKGIILRLIRAQEVKVNPVDSFLVRKPRGRGGLRDLSTKHDGYLYAKRRGNLLDYIRTFAPDEELASALEKVLEERGKVRLRSARR